MRHISLILIATSIIFSGCNTTNIHLYDFSNIRETDNSFIISPSANILFSQSYGDNYQIFSYHIPSQNFDILPQPKSNNKSPFFFNNEIYYLTEVQRSEENYKLTDEKLSGIVNNRSINEIVSSKSGNTVLIKFKDNDSLFILNSRDHLSLKFIYTLEEDLNAAEISEEYNVVVISSGNKLLNISLSDSSVFEVGKNWNCKKLNPFIYKDSVYFASYGTADNYQIYCTSLRNSSESPVLVLQTRGYDLRLPKKNQSHLSFIEIQNSNYLLKYFDTATNQLVTVNEAGVVYNYEFYNGQIFYVYSDLITPRGLKRFDLKTKKNIDITCQKFELNVIMNMLSKDSTEPPAYIFSTFQKQASKGIILYFHPGRRGRGYDFSPRWDNMILPFCLNGFTILCPNFPMSTGYGKMYESQSFDSSVNYMAKWVDYVHIKYPEHPIYLYGSSSGCVLMEACLLKVSDKVTGAISAFGLSYSSYFPDKTPLCFVLGKKDLIVPFDQRLKMLEQLNSKGNMTIVSLDAVGHWIQRPENFVRYYEQVLSFLAAEK